MRTLGYILLSLIIFSCTAAIAYIELFNPVVVLKTPTINIEVEKTSWTGTEEKRTVCLVMNDNERELKKIDQFDDAYQVVSFCEMDSLEVSTAMSLFYHFWVKEFGDSKGLVLENLNRMTVEWGEEEKVVAKAYTVTGEPIYDEEVIGLTLTKNYIWVYRDKTNNIANTSFIHELVHATLWAVHGSPDADHESTVYKNEDYWTRKHTIFIVKVNKILSSLNI